MYVSEYKSNLEFSPDPFLPPCPNGKLMGQLRQTSPTRNGILCNLAVYFPGYASYSVYMMAKFDSKLPRNIELLGYKTSIS